ncbi:4-hydroxy-tetrahydrodipicolinate synthase [Rhodoplanes sp. Z2-YC6860]|uniref:4-hydroxy-tetrahydrodipicolinate synthase n=1 Tax=Rhodoplanes sp. Z2-YC6860 TaxID=674703 RepID=UPI00078BFA84|nr:4-hydroxy-tetrahydrodipicolinate synthase [Rhodoplanes sp. Z2-YC6860]AMN41977.1 dihydrodipicolinate synthase [Rhodoplanes sp. Z2-YC6860]
MSTIGRHVTKLSGYAPALPTPFNQDGNLDADAFAEFCSRQVDEGASALVVADTMGEAPTLTPAEHVRLIHIAREVSNGRVPVIAGCGSNSTEHAVDLTQEAEDAGADAVLLVVPYYNKPTQAGLIAHFREIAQSTALPVFLHDEPSRTVCGLADATVARLAELPQIIGLKDATGDVTRPCHLRPLVGAEFRLMTGDDATALGYLAQGGDGCISVTSNMAPGLCRNVFLAYRQGQIARAQRLAVQAGRLTSALLCEATPAPLKYALSTLGWMSPDVRLPMVPPGEAVRRQLDAVIAQSSVEYAASMIGRRLCFGHRPRAA